MNDMWKGGVAFLIGALSAMSLAAWLCDAKSWWILMAVLYGAAAVGGILGQSLYILACDLWNAFWDTRKGK